jgi:hypothetical protein
MEKPHKARVRTLSPTSAPKTFVSSNTRAQLPE